MDGHVAGRIPEGGRGLTLEPAAGSGEFSYSGRGAPAVDWSDQHFPESQMPHPFGKAKMTGDTHPPEVEPGLPLAQEGAEETPARGAGKARVPRDQDGSPRQSDASEPDSGRGAGKNRS